jgi:hypothetical protein
MGDSSQAGFFSPSVKKLIAYAANQQGVEGKRVEGGIIHE